MKNGFRCIETDKTGKIGVCSDENYEYMGKEHTSKDEEITHEESFKDSYELDGHTSMRWFGYG